MPEQSVTLIGDEQEEHWYYLTSYQELRQNPETGLSYEVPISSQDVEHRIQLHSDHLMHLAMNG